MSGGAVDPGGGDARVPLILMAMVVLAVRSICAHSDAYLKLA